MAVDPSPDSTTIQHVLSGQCEAFSVLVERYFETVRLVALAKTGNVADAEDVAQDTFLKAYETLGVLRDHSRLAPWLVTIARNLAVSLIRKQERERRNAPHVFSDRDVRPDHERQEFYDTVVRQVESLPVNLREVVLLYYFEGLKTTQIAERLDVSSNAVVKRLSRGRELLGDRLLREWGLGARTADNRPRIHQVLGAIAALPQPDWKAQLNGMVVPDATSANAVWQLGRIPRTGTLFAKTCMTILVVVIVGYCSFVLSDSDKNIVYIPTEGRPLAPEVSPKHSRSLSPVASGGVPRQERNLLDGLSRIPIESPPPRREVGFVSGTVHDQNGTPIGDAQVTAVAGDTSGYQTTNPNGEFRINLTSPVPTIEAGDTRKYVNLFGHKVGFAQAMVPDIALGTTGVRLVLSPPARLSGTVVDAATGNPVSAFSIRIDRPDKNPETGDAINRRPQEFNATTGAFTLHSDHGIDVIRIVASGYVGTHLEPLLTPGDSEDNVVIALEPGGTIHGFVYDAATRAPISGASVHVDYRTVPPLSNYGGKTGADGGFTIVDLPPSDTIALNVDAKNYAMSESTEAHVDDPAPVKIYLGRGGSVRGRVLYAGGPPPGARDEDYMTGYCVVWIDGSPEGGDGRRSGYVRADGTYEVLGLAEGTYAASAFFWPPNGHRQSEQQSLGKVVHVRDGQSTTLNIDYDEAGGKVEVTVGGAGPAAVAIEILSAAAPDSVLQDLYFQDFRTPHFGNYGTLESGGYLVRARNVAVGTLLVAQEIQVRSGQVTEVHLDLAGTGLPEESEMERATGAAPVGVGRR